MSHRSIVNELLIQNAEIFAISSNAVFDFTFELAQFENGNFFFWGSTDFTDGTYILSFAESLDGNFANSVPISSDRIIIPEVVKSIITPSLSPFLLDASTQGIQLDNGLMRQLEIRGIATLFTHAVITSTGVTVGATLFLAWVGATENSPVFASQVP